MTHELPRYSMPSPMHHLRWSQAEKVVARKAFDRALHDEIGEVIKQAKTRMARVKGPGELWELEAFLTRQRKEIDEKYDYRYSVLPIAFGRLIHERRLTAKDLDGLGDDKMYYVRSISKSKSAP